MASKILGSGQDKIQGFIGFTAMVLLGITLIGMLGKEFGIFGGFTLGPGFMLLIIAGLVLLFFQLVRGRERFTGRDIFFVMIAGALALFLLFQLPQLVPEIFSGSIQQLQSMFGLT